MISGSRCFVLGDAEAPGAVSDTAPHRSLGPTRAWRSRNPRRIGSRRTWYCGPRGRVWRALTDVAAFGNWFGVRLEGAFVPGERLRGQIADPE